MRRLYLRALVAFTCLAAQAAFSQGAATDWPTYNGDLSSTRFSNLKEVTKANVKDLKQACVYDTGQNTAFQTGIVAVSGVLYFATHDTTYAVDGATCGLKWKHTEEGKQAGLGVNRGVAVADGRVFRGTGDARVIALDAQTGDRLWSVSIGDPAMGESVPMAPIAWNGVVFVGNAGGDMFGVTGRIYALSAQDGHELWRFHVVPESGPARATWLNVSAENPPTGGATWTSYSLDTAGGVLWISTGNVAPDFMLSMHPGDNLYTTSVVALDAKTGKLLRYVQPVKKDFHDWDMTSAPVLIRTRGGRELAAAAGKDGMLYGIDRSELSGKPSEAPMKILYSTPVTTHTNVKTPLSSTKETRFCPGTLGGSEWNGPAFHSSLNLLFVNSTDWCVSVILADPKDVKGKPGQPYPGSGDPKNPFGRLDPAEKWGGWLTALDADSGRIRWKYKSPTPLVAGVTPTAGGLVFTGDLNGDVLAFDPEKGGILWRDATGAPIGGGVISYEANGHQRIAVAAGIQSPIWPTKKVTARVIVYGLP